MKKFLILAFLVVIVSSLIVAVSAEDISVTISSAPGGGGGNPGSIWTTRDDCGDEQQNVNQYDIGEKVWINGRNFNEGDYEWAITGQPGGASCDPNIVVVNGTRTVDSSGSFCFNAYTVLSGDCGEYKVDFNNKHDNYNVIPEFGLFVGMITILSAVGVFFVIRKK